RDLGTGEPLLFRAAPDDPDPAAAGEGGRDVGALRIAEARRRRRRAHAQHIVRQRAVRVVAEPGPQPALAVDDGVAGPGTVLDHLHRAGEVVVVAVPLP